MSSFLLKINNAVRHFEQSLCFMFRQRFPPEHFGMIGVSTSDHAFDKINTNENTNKFSLKDLIGDGILWAVPRNRRTIEKRWKRKFGSPEYVMKLLMPKSSIRVCNSCGHDHEVGTLCPHCYDQVRKETELIQKKIENELGLNPIEQDVIVLYEGEKNEQPSEYWQGKRIVEMEKPRPMWFSKNLIQKTTQQPATTKEIKPNDLG